MTIDPKDVSQRDEVYGSTLAKLDKLNAAGEEKQNADQPVS
jgi:hypothetical protein